MASLSTDGNGNRRVLFYMDNKRKCLRIGKLDNRDAEDVLRHVERLVQAQNGATIPPATTAWIKSLPDRPHGRLARFALVTPRRSEVPNTATLGNFLERYSATLTCKLSTRTFYGHTRRNLEDFFGTDRVLRSIGTADADAWRAWLVEHERLSPATVARRVIAARTFWTRAIRWKLAAENPFDGVKAGHQANDNRKVFVPGEVIDRIIEATPDLEWRVIIALARYGGLRCPSEHFALRWGDIDWDRGTIRVTCPKLAHYEHLAQRIIPLFSELREHLLALFAEAPEGTEHSSRGTGSAARTCGRNSSGSSPRRARSPGRGCSRTCGRPGSPS